MKQLTTLLFALTVIASTGSYAQPGQFPTQLSFKLCDGNRSVIPMQRDGDHLISKDQTYVLYASSVPGIPHIPKSASMNYMADKNGTVIYIKLNSKQESQMIRVIHSQDTMTISLRFTPPVEGFYEIPCIPFIKGNHLVSVSEHTLQEATPKAFIIQHDWDKKH